MGSCGDQQLSGSALYWLGTCATGPVGLPPSFAIYLRWWFSKHGNVRVMGSVAQWGLRCPHTLRGLVILSQHADNWGHPLGRAFAPPAGVPITANALVITSRGELEFGMRPSCAGLRFFLVLPFIFDHGTLSWCPHDLCCSTPGLFGRSPHIRRSPWGSPPVVLRATFTSRGYC